MHKFVKWNITTQAYTTVNIEMLEDAVFSLILHKTSTTYNAALNVVIFVIRWCFVFLCLSLCCCCFFLWCICLMYAMRSVFYRSEWSMRDRERLKRATAFKYIWWESVSFVHNANTRYTCLCVSLIPFKLIFQFSWWNFVPVYWFILFFFRFACCIHIWLDCAYFI